MQISVIIPTLDEADRIATLVTTLRDQGFTEIIVADGGSSDDTIARARNAGAVTVASPRGRGHQLAAGARAATGEILFFVHADSLPPASARQDIEHTLGKGISAGCFQLAFDHHHRLLKLYAFMSRLNHSLFTYGDQGLFLRRSTYQQVGGYSAIPLFEDVDILRRLRRAGRIIKLKTPMVTSCRRFLRDGVVRRELLSALLVGLYHAGIPPHRLEHWYRAEKAHRE